MSYLSNLALSGILSLTVTVPPALAGQTYTYSYTIIAYPGSPATFPVAVNDSGVIVGDTFDQDGTHHAFSYQNGVFTIIAVPGADDTAINSIGNNGIIAGYYTLNKQTNGFVLQDGQYHLVKRHGFYSTMSAVNSLGEAAGFSFAHGSSLGAATLIYKNGTFTSQAAPQSPGVTGFNAAETVVGTIYPPFQGYIHTLHGPVRRLAPAAATYTNAMGINDAGTVIGYTVNGTGGDGYVVYGSGPLMTFTFPGATYTRPYAISQSGDIVGSAADTASGNPTGFILHQGQFTGVAPPGATQGTIAVGINSQGAITGLYADDSGYQYGYLATPN